MKIAYICDGLAKCSDRPGCYRYMKTSMDCCTHTFEPAHARNGAVLDPQNKPERFHEIDLDGNETVWWEGDIIP